MIVVIFFVTGFILKVLGNFLPNLNPLGRESIMMKGKKSFH
jgi:hypothetical protein